MIHAIGQGPEKGVDMKSVFLGQTLHYALGNVIIRNQKFPKVKHFFAFIFHRRSFKPFLNDAKRPKFLYKYFVQQISSKFMHLFAKT